MKTIFRTGLFALLGALTSFAAQFPSQAETVAIVGGTVHTLGPQGVLENATVVIEDGRISAVGVGIAIPADATRVDAKGKVVTPGLFDSYTVLGLVEVGQAKESVDFVLEKYKLGSGFQISHGLNPASSLIPITRIDGITRAIVAPQSGVDVLAGQGAVVQLGSQKGFVVDSSVAVFATLGVSGGKQTGGSRGAAVVRLRQALEEARYYDAHRAAYDTGSSREYEYKRIDLEALVPVIRGKKALAVIANRASDIRAALALGRDYKLNLVLLQAVEGWKVADEIAKAGVPVILNPIENLPLSFDGLGASLENAAKLNAAGVTIAFTSGFSFPPGTHNARLLTQLAGIAVSYGLPWQDGLRAMTINPARIWNLSKSYGSLEVGRDADVVVWSGDPFELSTHTERVFIRGRDIPLESRQTRLRDRYMNLTDGGLPTAYRK